MPYPSQFTSYSQSKSPWHWSWPLELAKVKCKHANRMNIQLFLFDGNSKVCPTFHYLWKFRDVRYIDCDLQNGPRSKVKRPIESSSVMFCLMEIVIVCHISYYLRDIHISNKIPQNSFWIHLEFTPKFTLKMIVKFTEEKDGTCAVRLENSILCWIFNRILATRQLMFT